MNLERKAKRIIGVMSGTSMDGLDIVCVDLNETQAKVWEYNNLYFSTTPFNPTLLKQLAQSKNCTALELCKLDLEFGKFIGEAINQFLLDCKLDKSKIDAIASHGHTVFHQPENKLTLQIGNGNMIAKTTEINTICNFRERDVMNGGQGAPLVPIGDQLLFGNFADAFLNLGGFANISKIGKTVQAYDICPCNLILNFYSEKMGFEYDKNGNLGRKSGQFDENLLQQLENLAFYTQNSPKSLGTEWLENTLLPIFEQSNAPVKTKLRTAYEHIANQIASNITQLCAKQILLTGGGAKNSFLIELIQTKTKGKIILPDTNIIDFKEAIVFALLGALFLENKPNCLASVTGAKKDVCGGEMYWA